eukprot:s3509_g7.t1
MAVGTAGSQPRAPDRRRHAGPQPRDPDPSGHCRTLTASSRLQGALPDQAPDPSGGTAGPQPRAADRSGHQVQIPLGTAGPQPRAPDRSGHCRTSTAR